MGPSVVFDKSALQALSMDESVWFDQFLMGNITPLFYVETLADLEKGVRKGKTPEQVVGGLAAKTPLEAVPNVHHRRMYLQELAGDPQPMDGRPVLAGGTPKRAPDGKVALHFKEFPEAAALARWQNGEFIEIERMVAKDWRRELAEQDVDARIGVLKNILPTGLRISNLSGLKTFIDEFCSQSDKHVLNLMMDVLDVPGPGRPKVIHKWELAGKPPLNRFAPYAIHVFKVDLLYYLGIYRGFISGERASNKADMAYLYYVPFCDVFLSGDNLHARTVPLFLSDEQSFVDTQDMKAALKELDEHFDKLPDEIKQRGVIQFTTYPPSTIHNAITDIWDKHVRSDWREIAARDEARLLDPQNKPNHGSVADIIEDMDRSIPMVGEDAKVTTEDVDQMYITRKIPGHRGKWRMLSQDIMDEINAKKESSD